MHQQTWKSSLQLLLMHPPSAFLSLWTVIFRTKWREKSMLSRCLALYSRWQTQQTHTCFQQGLSAVQTWSEPTSNTRGNSLLILLFCNVLYRIVYHILTTVSRLHIVSWKNVVAGLLLMAGHLHDDVIWLQLRTRMHFAAIFVMQICVTHQWFFTKEKYWIQ